MSLPLGTRPGQIKNEPTKVEAYYSGKSLSMMREHFMNIENIWYGKGKNGANTLSYIGFKQYLESVDKSLPRDIPLITQVIPNQNHRTLTNKWNSEIRYSADYAKTAFTIDSALLKQYLDDVVKPIFDKLTKR